MRGEYWITEGPQVWEVSGIGDNTHETLVLRQAALQWLEDLGIEALADEIDLETELLKDLAKCRRKADYLKRTSFPKNQAAALWGILFQGGDPRLFALQFWVAGSWKSSCKELPSADPNINPKSTSTHFLPALKDRVSVLNI